MSCSFVYAQRPLAYNDKYVAASYTTAAGNNSAESRNNDNNGDERASYIQDFVTRFQKAFASFNATKLGLMKYFEDRLRQYGLPRELKSLAYMESGLNLQALSSAGAKGPWQLMPQTAQNLGLRVNGQTDERTDVVLSTTAAINYLKSLYRKYHDWKLAVAAYNAGPGTVDYAIQRSGGSKDILTLESYLPEETKNYVRRFEAAVIAWGDGRLLNNINAITPSVMEMPVAGPTARTSAEERKLNAKGLASYTINAGFRLDVIAASLSVPLDKLTKLNKEFDDNMDKKGYTSLVLPKDKMTDFKLRLSKILAESLQQTSKEFE
jgi:membrane-bound lytic murein transglycosylase D